MIDEYEIQSGLKKIAAAITTPVSGAGIDAAGGCVESLTEAVMGVTAGLCRIADAIEILAEAISAKE